MSMVRARIEHCSILHDEQIERMNAEMENLDGQLEKFNSDITQLQNKLNDAKTRQRSIVLRHKTATSQLSARKHIHSDRLDEMLFRFENAERRIDRVESEAEAVSMGRGASLAEEIENRHGIQTELVVIGRNEWLDDDVRSILFRNARELLVNVVKHARAQHLKIHLKYQDSQIELDQLLQKRSNLDLCL